MFTSSPSTSRQILTVTKLNRLARTVLESEVGLIWLSAEISNFVSAASGHWYFTLKDNKAQVRAAMFKNTNRAVKQRPKEGDKVLVRASVGIYEARGDYQLIIEHMESDGEGALQQAYEALKAKLNAEGLFSVDRKRPMPEVINRIGVITSSTGAALHDVLSVLKRRSPQTEVIVYPSMVQGKTAPNQLINALRTANQRNEVDALLLTRGGGSLEDLWCFNNENLAREIAESQLTLISAVGHEVDFTIADFVADVRAPTPSAAAEILSQDTNALSESLEQYKQRLTRAMLQKLSHLAQQHKLQHQRLQSVHPQSKIQNQWQALDRLQLRLSHAINNKLAIENKRFEYVDNRLARQNPTERLNQAKARMIQTHKVLCNNMKQLVNSKQQAFAAKVGLLQSVSPLSTLSRGYSITMSNGKAVTSVDTVEENDILMSRVTDGEITSKIVEIRRHQ